MTDDERIDQLLQSALAADQPRLPASFDARVMQLVKPRRLTPGGRVALAAYVVLAAAVTAWTMQGIGASEIALGAAITGVAAIGASFYVKRLAT